MCAQLCIWVSACVLMHVNTRLHVPSPSVATVHPCLCVPVSASGRACVHVTHAHMRTHSLPHPPWQLSPPPHLSPHSSSSWEFSLSLLEGSIPAPACHTQGHQPCSAKAEKPEFLGWRTRKKQKAGDPPSEPTPGEPGTLPQRAGGQGPQARWEGCGLRGMPGFASSSMTLPG